MIGRGDTVIHPVYVDHVVQGLRRAAARRAAIGKIYMIGDATATTVRALAELIALLLDGRLLDVCIPTWMARLAATACEWTGNVFHFEPPLSHRRIGFFTRSAAFDISKARSELGYEPTVLLEEGLRRTILWYKEHGYIACP
jgi:nucleoside-diphosphate-sugar epimerase